MITEDHGSTTRKVFSNNSLKLSSLIHSEQRETVNYLSSWMVLFAADSNKTLLDLTKTTRICLSVNDRYVASVNVRRFRPMSVTS